MNVQENRMTIHEILLNVEEIFLPI
jgi:hypothetical protein